jgi:hypothetical protein
MLGTNQNGAPDALVRRAVSSFKSFSANVSSGAGARHSVISELLLITASASLLLFRLAFLCFKGRVRACRRPWRNISHRIELTVSHVHPLHFFEGEGACTATTEYRELVAAFIDCAIPVNSFGND